MLFKQKKFIVLLCISMLFIVSGCAEKDSSVEEIYVILEEVVSVEKPFVEQQAAFIELEKQEKDMYDQIMALGMKEHEQVVVLADKAIQVNEARKAHAGLEKDSIEAAKEEFLTIKPLIQKISEEEVKKVAETVYEVMMTRYDAHEELHENYMAGLQLDRDLYELFKQADVAFSLLEETVTKANEAYAQVGIHERDFNEATEKFNDTKQAFYKQAGFDVQIQNK